MTLSDPLRQNVVAVLRNGIIAGTGFFIDRDGSILTCFHVVGDTSTGYLTDQPLSIRFNGVTYPVNCIFRSLIPEKFDVAVLRLESRVLPDNAILLPLGRWDADSMMSHNFVSYGYKLAGTFDGIYARSTVVSRTSIDLKGRDGVEFLQIASESLTHDEVGRGMSGAPVYHEETNQIVGVIVARSRHKDLAIPLALPMNEVARIWWPVRTRIQQDELARQIGHLVSDYSKEPLLQKFVDRLKEMSVFTVDSPLEGDKPQVVIEQLRREGFIYDVFSYMKQADEVFSPFLKKKLPQTFIQRSEITFVNREEALSFADLNFADSFGPLYLLFDAPAGYGKTELLWEIELRDLLEGWICYYIQAAQTSVTAYDLAQTLANSANLSRYLPTHSDLGPTSGIIAVMLKEKVKLARAQGLVLLIDSIERLSDRERNSFRDQFLKSLISAFTDHADNKQGPGLRIVLAGRYASPEWKQTDWTFPLEVKPLKPFNYDIVLIAIDRSRWKNRQSDLKSWAAHLMYVTGGHPGCIAESLPLMQSQQSIEDHFISHRELYRDVVLPTINEVRGSIPKHLQDIFDRLSVFRRYNVRLLRKMIDMGVISYGNDAVNLERELTSTYLVNRRNKFIQDEIVRRLLVIRLGWTDSNLFLQLCEQARNIYRSDLEGRNTDPENIMVEAIYQELQLAYYQSKQDSEERGRLRRDFLGENGVVERYIRTLAAKSDLEDIKSNLKELLIGDWEFRFAVNFFLRSDRYTDEPFEVLMRYIDQI